MLDLPSPWLPKVARSRLSSSSRSGLSSGRWMSAIPPGISNPPMSADASQEPRWAPSRKKPRPESRARSRCSRPSTVTSARSSSGVSPCSRMASKATRPKWRETSRARSLPLGGGHLGKGETEIEVDDRPAAARHAIEDRTHKGPDPRRGRRAEDPHQSPDQTIEPELEAVAQRGSLFAHDSTSGNNRHSSSQSPVSGTIPTSTTQTAASFGILTASLAVVTTTAPADSAASTAAPTSASVKGW